MEDKFKYKEIIKGKKKAQTSRVPLPDRRPTRQSVKGNEDYEFVSMPNQRVSRSSSKTDQKPRDTVADEVDKGDVKEDTKGASKKNPKAGGKQLNKPDTSAKRKEDV